MYYANNINDAIGTLPEVGNIIEKRLDCVITEKTNRYGNPAIYVIIECLKELYVF